METAEKHKDKLDVEYVDEAGNIVPKHMVESNDSAYIPDIEKTPYVERKVKRKETDRDTRKETGIGGTESSEVTVRGLDLIGREVTGRGPGDRISDGLY